MVTFECPWCAEPVACDASTFTEVTCEPCSITVEIAADPTHILERAA